MSKFSFRIHNEAVLEARDAKRWYRDRNVEVAERFSSELKIVEGRIRAMPLSGAPYLLQTRHMLVPDFPYHVIYTIHDKTIVVVAIAHTSRNPGYWSTRLQ